METKVEFCEMKGRNNHGPPSLVMRDWEETHVIVKNALMLLQISVIANLISTLFEILYN